MEPPKFTEFNDNYRRKLYSYFVYNLPRMNESDRKLIKKAFEIAYKAHNGVTRKGGLQEAYITHPIEVALIISNEMGFGATSISAALLHDVVEDNPNYPIEKIKKIFGNEIATIVEGVTKITNWGNEKKDLEIDDISGQKLYFMNMLNKIPLDFRVLLIKVADRIHNMRTMDDMPEKSKKIKSSENLYIYAPLAGRAGLWNLKRELEDRSFKYLKPEEYEKILTLRKNTDNDSKKKLLEFQAKLKELIHTDYDFDIKTLHKSLYEISQKIILTHTPYDRIHNKYSTQIIVDIFNKDKSKELKVKRDTAYNIYVQISNLYDVRNTRDHIIHPKTNGFCALVFDVMYYGSWQEVQILSKRDAIIAERGWIDKDNAPGLKKLQQDIKSDILEVMNQIEEQLNSKMIYVFTPKGDRIELNEGATILDFAFKIHKNIGYKCWGAIINEEDKRVPRGYKLKNMDQVNIQSVDYIKPNFDWLEFATLPRTKKIIKSYLKNEYPLEYEEYVKRKEKISEIGFNSKKPFFLDNSIEFITAKCCKPVKDERCFIHRENENKLVVHTATCHKTINLLANNSSNIALVEWGIFPESKYFETEIEFDGNDRIGIAQDIVTIVSKNNILLTKISLEQIGQFFKGFLIIRVKNIDQLNNIIKDIESIKDIMNVHRISQ